MRLRFFVLIGLSLSLAGGAAYMTQAWLSAERSAMAKPAPAENPAPKALTAQVLVAAADLPAGTILKGSDLRWQPWPEDGLAAAYVVRDDDRPHDFTGAVVRQGLVPGEPVTEGRVVRPGGRGFLAAMLNPGKRAISVPINAASGISGLIFPGDRVDVVLTHTVPGEQSRTGTPRRASETVLHDIRVLALDQRTDDQDGEPSVAKTVTLELSPKQAERVLLAQQLGSLSLTLRPVAKGGRDDGLGPAISYTVDSQVSALVATPDGAGEGHKVTVVRGGKVDETTFDDEDD